MRRRFSALTEALGEREYLAGTFSAADILMSTVMRNLRHVDLVAQFPAIRSYCERCEARPAFKRALDAQLADFADQP